LVNNSRLRDPLESASTIIEGDPTAFLVNNGVEGSQPTEFADTWRRMGVVAEGAVDNVLATLTFPNEPEIARTLSRVTPPGSALYMASSMPIRDLDTFGTGRRDIRPLANRGVNGIDGTISSAIGAALAGIPTSLLIGDVAALHDATAIAEAAALGVPLRIIVVNNDGGGIFSFLPQASSDLIAESAYERHWGTPHGLSLADIAQPMNVSTRRITTLDGYAAAVAAPIDAPELIELITNRSDNVALHNAIRDEVAAALRRGEDVQ
jgi:2-succinyl-5-enolpyruvyl-6-hydroxy-3-cyclohexene-1-carboxylate synthase